MAGSLPLVAPANRNGNVTALASEMANTSRVQNTVSPVLHHFWCRLVQSYANLAIIASKRIKAMVLISLGISGAAEED